MIRMRFQFQLRQLFVGVALIAAFLATMRWITAVPGTFIPLSPYFVIGRPGIQAAFVGLSLIPITWLADLIWLCVCMSRNRPVPYFVMILGAYIAAAQMLFWVVLNGSHYRLMVCSAIVTGLAVIEVALRRLQAVYFVVTLVSLTSLLVGYYFVHLTIPFPDGP